ncbi:hypothetical protein KI688_011394 [Linnemannia hyalina]|uniref:AAA-ATPase-like domain-containing protein n=1 Tax=Linnemannia hyalina TaxID=64524 RepID=A0A9P7XVA2_9FUNG|nr:hypothetical protein KI688_011394 [Linnemannia hyalina]
MGCTPWNNAVGRITSCARSPHLLRLQSRALKVFCAIDGTRKAFPVDINDNDTGSDLQERIKLNQPIRLSMLEASDLNLYKAPKGGGITEPGVTVGAKDEINAISSLRGMFAETNTVQVIVRPPSFVRGPLNTLRQRPELCYFDKTAFILALESFDEPALVFLRPRRSGKSLGLSTLAHFHGREHLPDYKPLFEGLAIDEHVKKERLNPGRYFVLWFDFSAVNRSQDLKKAEHNLNLMLNESIKRFYKTYEPYLQMSADYLIENFIKDNAALSLNACVNAVHRVISGVKSPEDPLSKIKGIYLMADEYDSYSNEYLVPIDSVQWKPPRRADTDSLLKAFWASVKSGLGKLKIAKCYITGVSPQSLVDNTSGFNVARYVSWEPELASFCGLTEADVTAALALKNVCESTAEAEKHLKIMRDHYNGFNFVPGGQGPLTYNTNTCLKYLERLAVKKPMENPLSVTNSEASEVSLRLLAASPVATRLSEDGLFSGSEQGKNVEDRVIPFDNIGQPFTLASLIAKSKEAWLSYMVHLGGLTFCVGKKALRIPNLVTAERFGSAILHRHQATLEDVNGAFRLLIDNGNIDKILGLYARGMQEHDIGAHDFQKEEDHCNSMRFTLLANIHPSLQKVGVETTITKPSGTPGRIGMLVSVPLRKRLFVLEWKSIQIDYINIGSGTRLERANVLAEIPDANRVLGLKFRGDKFRTGQTIKEWILDGPKVGKGCSPEQQLRGYAQSPEIKRWKKDGYTITPALVVVVGSRHVLLWNLDGDRLDSSPRLTLE